MFSFLKKFFQEEQPKEKVLNLQQLEQWIAEKEKQLQDSLKKILWVASDEISEAKENLQHSIEELKNANLQNPNIPPKAVHFMQGNRESYVKLATLLIRDALPQEIASMGYAQARQFIANFKGHVESFLSSSLRNYQVLQHFFAHESSGVAGKIKKIESAVKKMEGAIAECGLDAVAKAKDELANIKQKLARKQELVQERAKMQEHVDGAIKDSQKAQKDFSDLESSDDAKVQRQRKDALKNVEERIAQLDREIAHRFSPLEKALRKLSKMSFGNEGLIALYGEHPERAIRGDGNIAILDILRKLEQELLRNSLGLDAKRTQKVLEAIKMVSLAFLNDHMAGIHDLEKEKEAIGQEIQGAFFEQKMQALRAAIEKAQAGENLARQRLAIAEEQVKGISVGKNKESIESTLSASFPEKIVVVVDEIK